MCRACNTCGHWAASLTNDLAHSATTAVLCRRRTARPQTSLPVSWLSRASICGDQAWCVAARRRHLMALRPCVPLALRAFAEQLRPAARLPGPGTVTHAWVSGTSDQQSFRVLALAAMAGGSV